MSIKNSRDLITDDELQLFLEKDFYNKLEGEFLQTELGKRAKMLEDLGLGISISSIIDTYISQEGYTLDAVGNLSINELSLFEIYTSYENSISEALNIDISNITDIAILKRIVSDPEYKMNVARYGIEGATDIHNASPEKRESIKQYYSDEAYAFLFSDISSEEVKAFFDRLYQFEKTDTIIEKLCGDTTLGVDREQVIQIVKKVEQQTIETSIENKETTQTIRCLYRLRDAINQSPYNSEISRQTEIQDTMHELQEVLEKSQYKRNITDEDGNIDIEKCAKFLDNWEKVRNENKVFEDLSKIINADVSKLNGKTLPFVLILLKRAEKGDNEDNKKIAEGLAKRILEELKIDLLNGERLDREKIANLYEKVCDGADIDSDIEQEEWNSITAEEKLNRIDLAIDNELGINRDSRDQINRAKELSNELQRKQEEDKKITLEQVILEENCSPEKLIALFYEFRYNEWKNSKKIIDKFGARQLTSAKEHGIANIIKTYILEHPEHFREYITEKGNLSGAAINDFINTYEFSNLDKKMIASTYRKIEQRMASIESKKTVGIKKSNELLIKIDELRKKTKEEISEKEKKKIFNEAKKLGKSNSLSKVILKELFWIDKNRFRELMEKNKNHDNKQSGVWFKRTISDFKARISELPKIWLKRNDEKSSDTSINGKVDTMRKSAKGKSSKNTVINELEGQDEDSKKKLPMVKKKTIFDIIRNSFFKNRNMENFNTAAESPKGSNASGADKNPSNPEDYIIKESLTGDTTVTSTEVSYFDSLRVESTPTINIDSSSQAQNNSDEKNIDGQEYGD